MKKCTKVSLQELLLTIQEMNRIFDIVRVVNPATVEVLILNENRVEAIEKRPCFAVWEKDDRCDNCISMRACTERCRECKFEFRNEEIFLVISCPFEVMIEGKEQIVALELVNKIENDMFMMAHGSGLLTDRIAEINYKLYVDSLTGAYNRRYFDDRIYLYEKRRTLITRFGFFVIDVQRFKYINDTFGHTNGDIVLKKIAQTLIKNVRVADSVIRIGGDEFAVVFKDCNTAFLTEKMLLLKEEVRKLQLDWMKDYRVEINIGASCTETFDGSEAQIQALFEEADHNMYEEKRRVYGRK